MPSAFNLNVRIIMLQLLGWWKRHDDTGERNHHRTHTLKKRRPKTRLVANSQRRRRSDGWLERRPNSLCTYTSSAFGTFFFVFFVFTIVVPVASTARHGFEYSQNTQESKIYQNMRNDVRKRAPHGARNLFLLVMLSVVLRSCAAV